MSEGFQLFLSMPRRVAIGSSAASLFSVNRVLNNDDIYYGQTAYSYSKGHSGQTGLSCLPKLGCHKATHLVSRNKLALISRLSMIQVTVLNQTIPAQSHALTVDGRA